MNQILFFEEKGVGSSMNKTIKFFALSVMAFGIILIGEGGYSFAKSKNEVASGITTTQEAEELKPTIEYEQNNSKLTIKIDGKSEISKVTYSWNNEIEKDLLNISGQLKVETEIDIPTGTNRLNMKVVYRDGQNFVYEQTKIFDLNTAKIDFDLKGTNIKIKVADKKGIDYVSYRWNDGEEHIQDIEGQDNTEIELLAEIPFGLNTLTATSVNVFGEKSEATLDVKGAEKPSIDAKLLENGILFIEVKCSDNIENVDLSINGDQYKLNILDFINQGYTIEQLNNSAGLHLEANEKEEIINLTYEFPIEAETIALEITAKSKYATQTVSGTLTKPTE